MIQAEVTVWTQDRTGDKYEPTREVLINPAVFEIPPGGEQIVRVALQAGEAVRERSYRLFLQELPNPETAPQGGAETLLRIGIPIFVPPMRVNHELEWALKPAAPGKWSLTVSNVGSIHTQIQSIRVLDNKGDVLGKEEILAYVLPGQARTWEIPTKAAPRVKELIYLEAVTDSGDVRAQVEINPSASKP